ncbi:MAG TPA: hypothetical protein VFE28_17225, partial [Candidatus Krumholzibacteria bacterium]|nr:hypothetical protein [Candidatus Krumholzibacteria bacterium]
MVQTITVTPEGQMVDVKSDGSFRVNTDKEILSLPVNEWTEGPALSTGVVVQGGVLHVRGPCRRGEISVRIDGVPVNDPLSGGSVDKSVQSPRATAAVMPSLAPQDLRFGRVGPVNADERPVPGARPAQPLPSTGCQGRVAAMLSPPALPPEVARRLDACECGTASAPTTFIAEVEEKGEPVSEGGALPKVTRLWGCAPNPFN